MKKRPIWQVFLALSLIGVGGWLWQTMKPARPIMNNQQVASEALDQFVRTEMINEAGGMLTTYQAEAFDQTATITVGHAVLSESQGLLLEYARLKDDEALFTQTLDFIETYLQLPTGQFHWRVSPTLTNDQAFTATIDDLQIIEQLSLASEQWPHLSGRIDPIIDAYATTFPEYALLNEQLIDGYDFTRQVATPTLHLSYLDFHALQRLRPRLTFAAQQQLDEAVKQGKAAIEQSYISDDFPFYHQTLFVATLMLEQRPEINMIETLLIVKHLAEVDEVEPTTISWLKSHVNSGIAAYYTPSGEPLTRTQSSAVYALIAQIAVEVADQELYDQAMAAIFPYQIHNSASVLNGALGNEANAEVIAYDQLQTLIASVSPHKKE